MPMIRAILFDCFHTLIDLRFDRLPVMETADGPVRSSAPALAEEMKRGGFDVSAEAVHGALVESWRRAEAQRARDHQEVHARQRLGHMLELLELPREAERLIDRLMLVHSEQLLAAMTPVDGARELLETLFGRLPIGMVSNFDRGETVHEALRVTGLSGYFHTVVVSATEGIVKPHPEIFRRAARHIGVAPEEIIFVGDQPHADMEGALAAGMHPVWFAYRAELADQLPDGCRRVDSLTELSAKLAGLLFADDEE